MEIHGPSNSSNTGGRKRNEENLYIHSPFFLISRPTTKKQQTEKYDHHKDRHTHQWNKSWSLEFDPYVYGKLAHKLLRTFSGVAILITNSTGASEEPHTKAWDWTLHRVNKIKSKVVK